MSVAGANASPPPQPARERWWGRRAWLWRLLFALALLAILALAAFLWLRQPEVVYRTVPGPAADPAQVRLLEEERARADRLRAEMAALQSDLIAEECPPGTIRDPNAPAIVPFAPDGPIDGQDIEGGAAATSATTAAPVPDPGPQLALQTPPAPPAGAARPLSQRALVERLNNAVALVLTEKSSATGFFIAPGLLVTNRHAVEDAVDGQVVVTSKVLGRLHVGRVVAVSAQGPSGSADYAIVRVADADSVTSLPLARSFEVLSDVVSAGYPGLTIINDAGFRALLAGDMAAAPELVLSRGEVQAVQHSPSGSEVIVHSGDIMQGSSGGPVVDSCGRVVGINTYIAVDARQSGKVSYALSARELGDFLGGQQAVFAVEDTECTQ